MSVQDATKSTLEKLLQQLSKCAEKNLSVSQLCNVAYASAYIAALLMKKGWWSEENYIPTERK